MDIHRREHETDCEQNHPNKDHRLDTDELHHGGRERCHKQEHDRDSRDSQTRLRRSAVEPFRIDTNYANACQVVENVLVAHLGRSDCPFGARREVDHGVDLLSERRGDIIGDRSARAP